MLNLAVGGATTRDALQTLDDAMPVGPAVFSFGTNDAAPWKQVPLDELRLNYRRILGKAQGKIVVLGPTPVSEPLGRPRTNVLQRHYSEAAAAVTADVSGTFIDLIDVLGGEDDALLDDGVHLSDVAYERLAGVALVALGAAEL